MNIHEAISICRKAGFRVIPKERVKMFGITQSKPVSVVDQARFSSDLEVYIFEDIAHQLGRTLVSSHAARIQKTKEPNLSMYRFEASLEVVFPE